MIYLDTNVIISLLAEDSGSAAAEAWWAAQSVPLAVSSWVRAEFYSHIGLRHRKAELTARQAAAYVDEFDSLVATSISLLKASDDAVLRASTWLRSSDCSMQTADAVHLAIALENEAAAIATFDVRFASAIEKLRIGGLKVITLPVAGKLNQIQQKLASYNVTERDVAKAVKWARKRKTAEREKAPRLTVR